MRCCTFPPEEGEWKDVYDDPVRPRRTGYECPPDFLQIGAWSVIIILAILHYMIQIPFMEGALFIVALVITSVLMGGVVVTKITLELYQQEDPVVFPKDLPRLSEEELNSENAPEGTIPCVFCRRFVSESCKHCSVCDKCVPGFDHHCRWLNSCVGSKNYALFATFMGFAWVGMAWIVAMSLYTIVDCLRDVSAFKDKMQRRAYRSPRNAFPAIVVFNFVCLLLAIAGCCALGKLVTFHIYLHCTHQTTYQNILKKRAKKKEKEALKEKSEREQQQQQGQGSKKEDDGCCALRKRRDFKKHSKKPDAQAAESNNNNNNTAGSNSDRGSVSGENHGEAHSPDEFSRSQHQSANEGGSVFNAREPFDMDLKM